MSWQIGGRTMNAIISELVVYLIKFFAMIIFAGAGIFIGIKLRKRKNEQLAAENNE